MSNVQRYIRMIYADKDQALSIAQDTARGLESNQLTLIETVQSLGQYINDDDSTVRAGAVDYLAQIIGQLSPTFLSRQQIQVLCQFLCDRIEDGGAVGGLRKLQALGKFNRDLVAVTFRAMLEHFQDLQLRPQAQRLQILELLHDLMWKHRGALKELGKESIVGIVDLVSGEKDPRNLMVIFSVLKVIMVEWDISAHAELLFDSVFCYFPITFRPPPDDLHGITAQDLKTRLRDCIAASGYFAPFAFPRLLDKLDSTSPNVKHDVLQTIKASVSSYGTSAVSNYAATLWESLKFEIFNVQEGDSAEEALASVQAIAIRLGRGLVSTDPKTPLARYLRLITKDCNEQLLEPQHKQAKPAGQILSALGIASPIAFFLIVKAIVLPLLTLYEDAGSIEKQRALLEVLVQMLDSAIPFHGTPSLPAPVAQIDNPLAPFKERLFELTSQALMSSAADQVSFRVVALKALLRLCLLRRYLEDNEIGMAVQYLGEIVLLEDPKGEDDLKREAIQALVELSKIKPNLIMDITFPAFMARLPDSSPSHDWDYLITLEGLAQLSVEKYVADTLIRRLLNRLDIVLQNEGPPAYPQAILSTLQYVLSHQDLDQDPNLSSYYERIVVGLTNRAVLASVGKAPRTALNEVHTLETLGHLAMTVIRALDEHEQRLAGLQIYSLFVDEADFLPIPFTNNTSKLQMSTMILSTSIMAGVKHSVSLQFLDPGCGPKAKLLAELVRLALSEEVPPVRQAILRQIGLLTNKFMIPQQMDAVLEIFNNLASRLFEITIAPETAVQVVFWVAKGLMLRFMHTDQILERLLNLLTVRECGVACARGFEMLLAPDEVLSKENGARIRLLVKQKVFSICVPHVAKEFPIANPATKSNYLIALSGILKHMPTEVVMPEIDPMLPLLLQSLDLEDSDLKAATLQTLTVVSQENPRALEGHVGSLVSRLLSCVTFPLAGSVNVRYNALRCLRIFPRTAKGSTLLPYKDQVTKDLRNILDDPKRLVRKEAVECRAAWFNMDEPQSD